MSNQSIQFFSNGDFESVVKSEESVTETLQVNYFDNPVSPELGKIERSLYFRDGIRRIDFVLAYREDNDDPFQMMRQEFEESLTHEGFEIERDGVDLSFDGKTCFIKIHAPWDVLARHAEFTNLRMPVQIDERRSELNVSNSCNPFEINYPPLSQKIDYFTAPFKREHLHQFIVKDKDTFFSTGQRSRLTWEILTRIKYGDVGRRKVGIAQLIHKKAYLEAYPLHEGDYESSDELQFQTDRALLYEFWVRPVRCTSFQPLDLVRKYFGSKIGFYFAWLGFYTQMLIPAALVGLLCFIYGAATFNLNTYSIDVCDLNRMGNVLMCPLCNLNRCRFWYLKSACIYTKVTYLFDNGAIVFYAVFMSFWATLLLEFWKRKQSELIWRWDLQGFEESQEVIRPEFEAQVHTRKRNTVTKMLEPHLTFWDKLHRNCISVSGVSFMLCVIISSIFGVIVYRTSIALVFYSIDDDIEKKTSTVSTSITAALINLTIIIILNLVYEKVASVLTEYECPRTQIEYESSFTLKMFLFKFLNYYSSIFYVAFLQGRLNWRPGEKLLRFLQQYTQDECKTSACKNELCIQIATIMLGNIILDNILEIARPKIRNWYNSRRFNQTPLKSRVHLDFILQPVPPCGLFDEYLEIVIQYGFVTMFVVAFPLAPLFALLNNLLEIRLDAYKFLTQMRRNIALRSDSIGAWYDILHFMSRVAVITNAFLIAFATDIVPSFVYKYVYSESTNNEPTFDGFLNHSLSHIYLKDFEDGTYDVKDFKKRQSENHTFCKYRDYRDNVMPYNRTLVYWHVFAMRLVFAIVFMHFIIFTTGVLAYLIKDTPKHVKQLIKKEKQLQYDLFSEKDKVMDIKIDIGLLKSPSHHEGKARIMRSTVS